LAAQPGVDGAVFDGDHTSVSELTRWREALPARLRRAFFTPLAAPLVQSLRMVKDEDELVVMAEAAALGCQLFDHILTVLRPGIAEIEVAAELEYKARMLGAEGMSFDTIVASGVRSSLPHGRASSAKLPRRGFVTMDFGVILKGYCSDMTRTVYLGSPKPRERAVYQAVFEAQQAGVDAVAAGVSCAEVDEAARSVLRAAKLADAFTHSTGHGVGLEIHEPPRVGAKQTARLEAGMVITIEPGVYLEGQFGLRIEDTVVVQKGGAQVLTTSPKALIEL
jgi:Xaa-Pro aminopeptidase